MSSKQQKLYSLIQNLSKSEKRYFKLNSKQSVRDKGKNYLKLFDLLEKMPQYDEQELEKKLSNAGVNTQYLAADKNHLFQLILRSLRNFHTARTSRLKVKECLEYAEILVDKGLLEIAQQQLQKSKKIALQHDLISYLPEILRMERKINGPVLKVSEIENLHIEYKESMEQLQDFNELDFLFRRANLIRQTLGKTRNPEELKKFDEVLKHPLLTAEKKLSFFAQLRFHQIWAGYYYSKNDWQKEYEENHRLLEFMAQKKEFLEEYPLEYAATFSRVLILSKKASPEKYLETLHKFRAIPSNTKRHHRRVKSLVECLAYSTEFVRMITVGEFDKAATIIPDFEKFLHEYQDLIEPAFVMNSYYKFAYVHIGLDDHSQALDYLNKVLNEFDEKLRPDVYRYAKILSLIVHLELGNYTLLPYIAHSVQNHFKSRQKLFETEKVLISFMKKVKPNAPKSENWVTKLPQLRERFEGIFQDENEKNALQYFDFMTWLESRIEERSFMEVKQEKV